MVKKVLGIIGIILVSLTIGFFIGRSLIEEVKLVSTILTLPETSISLKPLSMPLQVIPTYITLPARVVKDTSQIDSLLNILSTKVDSLKLFKDYISIRSTVNHTMYDNEYGKFIVSYDVLFNELQRFYNGKLEPKREVITKYLLVKYTPFVEAGYSTADYLNAGGGIIFNKSKMGLRYNYLYDLRNENRNGHLITIIKTF